MRRGLYVASLTHIDLAPVTLSRRNEKMLRIAVVTSLIGGIVIATDVTAVAENLLSEMSTRNEALLFESLGPLKQLQSELLFNDQKTLTGDASASASREQEELLNEVLRQAMVTAYAVYGDEKAIYGGDDRRDYYEPDVSLNGRLAIEATAALVEAHKLIPTEDDAFFELPSANVISGGVGLCTPEQAKALAKPEERYYDQPNPAFCSGFKVGPDLIATAGHCIASPAACEATRFVFGFYKAAAASAPQKRIAAGNIYKCVQIVGGEDGQGSDKSDWRVVRTDREIQAPQVNLRTSNSDHIKVGDPITVIGYPMGLPAKVAGNASVRSLSNSFFVANLDTYGGNSGSAVFNTGRLNQGELLAEGILVRGEADFEIKSPVFYLKALSD
jgi:hypothetical protein